MEGSIQVQSIKPHGHAFSQMQHQPRAFNASTPIVASASAPRSLVHPSHPQPPLEKTAKSPSGGALIVASDKPPTTRSTGTPSSPPAAYYLAADREAEKERARRHLFLYPPLDARAPLLSLDELRFQALFSSDSGSGAKPNNKNLAGIGAFAKLNANTKQAAATTAVSGIAQRETPIAAAAAPDPNTTGLLSPPATPSTSPPRASAGLKDGMVLVPLAPPTPPSPITQSKSKSTTSINKQVSRKPLPQTEIVSPSSECDSEGAPIPFPIRRPRVPSRPLPSLPSASASSSSEERTLKPQPSFSVLLTPTPTTPRVIERTWTRKVSLWPPALEQGGDHDPFAREIPIPKVPMRMPVVRDDSAGTVGSGMSASLPIKAAPEPPIENGNGKGAVGMGMDDILTFLRSYGSSPSASSSAPPGPAAFDAEDLEREALGRTSTSTYYSSHHDHDPSPVSVDMGEWSEMEAPATPMPAPIQRPVFARHVSRKSVGESVKERFRRAVGRSRSSTVVENADDTIVLDSVDPEIVADTESVVFDISAPPEDVAASPEAPSRSSTSSSADSTHSALSRKDQRPRLTLIVPHSPTQSSHSSSSPAPAAEEDVTVSILSPPPPPLPARSPARAFDVPADQTKPGEAVRAAIRARNEQRQHILPTSTPLSLSHSMSTTASSIPFSLLFDDEEEEGDGKESVYTRATSFASSPKSRRPSESSSMALGKSQKRKRGRSGSTGIRIFLEDGECIPDVPRIPAGLLLDEPSTPRAQPPSSGSSWPNQTAVNKGTTFEEFVREMERVEELDLTLSVPGSPTLPLPPVPAPAPVVSDKKKLSTPVSMSIKFSTMTLKQMKARSGSSTPVAKLMTSSISAPLTSDPPSTMPTIDIIPVPELRPEDRNSEDARVRARVMSLATMHPSPYAAEFANTQSSLSTKVGSVADTLHPTSSSSTALSHPAKTKHTSTKAKAKALAAFEASAFTESSTLSTSDVYRASLLPVLSTSGEAVRFGSLFEDGPGPTIVCFLRHFFCPLCQDYMRSIVDNAPKEALDRAGVRLVIIGCGSPALAKAYKDNVFHSPFEIYVDPTRALYRALGMTRLTLDAGPPSAKGTYVTHGPITGLGSVLRNALKMPLGKAGNIKQLGGEFVLGPGMRADYCHRMPTTAGHEEVKDLLEKAGVGLEGWMCEEAPGGGTRVVKVPSGGEDGGASPAPIVRDSVATLDVQVEDEELKGKKDAWDEFIRWTTQRKARLLSPTPAAVQMEEEEEPYPWAFADREVWSEHGGFCSHDPEDGATSDCASSIARPPSSLNTRVLRSWGIPSFQSTEAL